MIEEIDEIMHQLSQKESRESIIKQVYDILPAMNTQEIRYYVVAEYLTEKYKSSLANMIKSYYEHKKRNKSLGIFNSITRMLKYATLEEEFRGYKVNKQIQE